MLAYKKRRTHLRFVVSFSCSSSRGRSGAHFILDFLPKEPYFQQIIIPLPPWIPYTPIQLCVNYIFLISLTKLFKTSRTPNQIRTCRGQCPPNEKFWLALPPNRIINQEIYIRKYDFGPFKVIGEASFAPRTTTPVTCLHQILYLQQNNTTDNQQINLISNF